MVKDLLLLDKKGVSLMVGYVLLIVIALALATMVFAYLKIYLPKDEPECYKEISISIDSVVCSEGKIKVNVTNRGLFSIDGLVIRAGDKERVFKETLGGESIIFPDGLKPSERFESPVYVFSQANAERLFEIEGQAVVYLDNRQVFCPESVVRQDFRCEVSQPGG